MSMHQMLEREHTLKGIVNALQEQRNLLMRCAAHDRSLWSDVTEVKRRLRIAQLRLDDVSTEIEIKGRPTEVGRPK